MLYQDLLSKDSALCLLLEQKEDGHKANKMELPQSQALVKRELLSSSGPGLGPWSWSDSKFMITKGIELTL